jgi:hypothetical protein
MRIILIMCTGNVSFTGVEALKLFIFEDYNPRKVITLPLNAEKLFASQGVL